jgi:hypothetical protein
VEGFGHVNRKGDSVKIKLAEGIMRELVCGDTGRKIKEKDKCEKKILKTHNANIKKRVTALNGVGNEILDGFSLGLGQVSVQKEKKEPKKRKKNKEGANNIAEGRRTNKKGKENQHNQNDQTDVAEQENERPNLPKRSPVPDVSPACMHCSMLELTMMDHQYVKAYLQKGKYFNGKECKGSCGRQVKEISGKKGVEVYYCKFDFDRETMNGQPAHDAERCQYVICGGCKQTITEKFDKKLEETLGHGIRSRRIRKPTTR